MLSECVGRVGALRNPLGSSVCQSEATRSWRQRINTSVKYQTSKTLTARAIVSVV